MNIIEEFLSGKLHATEFMRQLLVDTELQTSIQSLIPHEAIADSDHEYWKRCVLRSGLECYEFDVNKMLFSHCGYAETESDQLELFNTIRSIYLWKHPSLRCTTLYEDNMFFYLELERDCFGGPEVTSLVKEIARNTVNIKPKSMRRRLATTQINELFHVYANKRPRWVQGPMWPMGIVSPMMFVSQKRINKSVLYTFQDIDTGATKIIEQFL